MNQEQAQSAELTSAQKRQLLAKLLEEKQQQEQAHSPGEKRYPLSFSQQRLWFLDRLAPGNPFYNVEAAIPVNGPLDSNILERVINTIVARHEALRTLFREDGDGVQQVVLPELKIPLTLTDLSHLPASQRETARAGLWTEKARQPFDLNQGPLLRTDLICLGYRQYLFLLTMHHIIADGWSMGVFGREMEQLYSAFAAGQPDPLPALEIQYGDYAVWQRKRLSGEVLEQQLSYWRNKLDGLTQLELPTDRPRPPVQTFRGDFHELELPKDLTDSLKALSKKQDATLFMTLLAAFKLLLYRYSGLEDLVVGTYIANRDRAEIEQLIGFFLNTLVLRTRFSGKDSFLDLLAKVRETALGAYEYQGFPFEKLVEELQPSRDLSRNPLFQVSFQLQNAPTQGADKGSQASLEFKRGAAIFDLAFMLFETPDGLRGQFEYSTELFDAATISRMASHYHNLLEAVVASPGTPICLLPLMTAQERKQTLSDWNSTNVEYSQQHDLIELLELRVKQHPDKTAFIEGNEKLTFSQLNAKANRLAHLLIDRGISPGTTVGLCLEPSLEQVYAFFALWKAGAIYLPLDPSYPVERLRMMLSDSDSGLLLTTSALASNFDNAVPVLALDTEQENLAAQPVYNPGIRLQADAIAYRIFTSGSSGRPKGISAPHRQILNRLHWMWRNEPFRSDEVACQKTALSFVDSLWELLGASLQGLPTVIVPEQVLRDPLGLVSLLNRHAVSRLWLVPSLLKLLLDHFPDLASRLPALSFWVCSGEPLAADLARQFREQLPQARLFNLYGTSEAWDATWYECSTTLKSELPRIPIGRPIDNVQAYVLDEQRLPVPIGVPGELWLAGEGLAQISGPDHNRRVASLGFPEARGLKAMSTGDKSRWLSDGNLDYLGRIGDQLKIRGFRVEPGEIEINLRQCSEIADAAVVPWEAADGDLRLQAFLVPADPDHPPQPTTIGSSLRRSLPEHMIPARYSLLTALPLTPSGKVDRLTLRHTVGSEALLTQAYIAPVSKLEKDLAMLWQKLLRVERVGLEDNFFELGGHSLLATRLLSRVCTDYKVSLPLQGFFEHPTVAAQALAISAAETDGTAQTTSIPRLSRERYRRGRTRS